AGLIEEAAERSMDLLRAASTKNGFVASLAFDHYSVIWARDGLISSLGALASGESALVETAAATIDTLTSKASSRGQVPALVNPEEDTWDFGEGGTVDATAWLPIAAGHYLEATGDLSRVRGWWPSVSRAVGWLAYQDVTGSGLISAAPSTDWMDAALTRSGRTLHMNVLYGWAVESALEIAAALSEPFETPVRDIGGLIDTWFWPDPARSVADLYPSSFAHTALVSEYERLARLDRNHYVSHIVHAAFVDVVDVLANSLAIVSGIAHGLRASAILDAIESSASPWPSQTFPEPVSSQDPSAMLVEAIDAVIDSRWSNSPGRYHNAAAWPYVGGFHAAAQALHRGPSEALPLLERLAEANALGDWRFSEWIGEHGPDGAPLQTWNAGTYLYAWNLLG
ncbi:MAG TPA: amylo-alpha-1,6-glucosidase, partial [Acidimicrobiia bacterium]